MSVRPRRRAEAVQHVPSKRRARRESSAMVSASESLGPKLKNDAGSIEPGWQKEVWQAYGDNGVPELRTIARITATTMSQVRLTIAKVSAEGEPSPLDPDEQHPAKDLLAQFAGGAGGQASMLDMLGTLMTVTGEAILVGALDPNLARTDTRLAMTAYAPSQIRNRMGERITIQMDETTRSDWTIDLSEDSEDLATAIRIWRPYPRYQWEADSAGRAALPILREIMRYDARLKANAESRLTGAGLLFIPEGMTLPGLAEDDTLPDEDPFMRLLIHVAATALKDPESAAAKVPIAIRADGDDIEKVRWMTFWTEFDDKILELRAAAINRLSVTADMPPELVNGLGETQHWTGSLVSDQWVTTYLAGLMTIICGSLTTGWLYPALAEQAASAGVEMPDADVIIWYDASSIRTRPNTAPEAQALFDRFAIGFDSLRRQNGFDEGDAPTPPELLTMMYMAAFKADPTTITSSINSLGLTKAITEVNPAAATETADTMDVDPNRQLLIDLVRGAPSLAPLLLPLIIPGIVLPEIAGAPAGGNSGTQPVPGTPSSNGAPGTREPAITPSPGG